MRVRVALALSALMSMFITGSVAAADPIIRATIPMTRNPQFVAVNPATDRVYVTAADETVVVIDAGTNAVLARVGVPSALGVAANSATNRIYVSSLFADTVSVIDGATNAVTTTIAVGSFPRGVAVNEATNRIYVVNSSSASMSVIDGATNTVIDTVAVPPSPLDVAVNPITNRIYVTGFSSQMAVIDGATNTVLSSIEVGPSVPLGVAIMTQGVAVDTVANRIFVANVATDSVVVVDGATNAVLRAISVGLAPQSIALNARGRRVYVTNRDDGTVAILNATRLNLDTILGVQEQPIGIAVHPRTNRLYVANNFTYSISVIEDEIVAVDTTPPTTAATSAPGPNALGWSRGDVTVHLAAIDDAGGSGVREIRFVATGAQTVASTTVPGASADVVITTAGVTTVSFFAVDNAGNTEAQRSVIVRIDRTAPTTVAAVVPAPNVLGWSRDDVAVHFAASDNAGGSGVREIHFTATGAQTVAATTAAGASTDVTISAEGATTVSYFAVDDAGNAEAQRSLVVRIDRTAPTVAFTGNAGTYAIDQQIAITCAAADTLSGLATNTCANVSGRAYTFPVGSTTLSAAATDNAGNAAQATTSFTVVVTASGVCNLTSEFVRSSPNYAELPQRAGADAIAAALCGQLDHIVASLTPEQKAGLLTAYGQGVDALARLGWLTESQSTLLTTLARML